MRVRYSLINSITSIFFSLVVGVLSMFRLKVFIETFGDPINGFFSLSNSVALAITFVQAGLGGIFMQKLYVLLSKDDKQAIVNLYATVQKICKYVTLGIFLICFGYSFIHINKYADLFKGFEVVLIYWLYMLPTVLSYYLRMPTFILMADQKGYLVSIIGECANIVSNLSQIILMILVPNLHILVISFIIFISSMSGYLINYMAAMHRYPFLRTSNAYPDNQYKDILVKMGQSIGASLASSVMTSVDTLMLAYLGSQNNESSLVLISVITIYNGIISMVKTMIQNMFSQVTASFGNLFANDYDNFRSIYQTYLKICLLLSTSVFAIVLCVINRFIILFYGSNQILDSLFLIIIISNALMEVIQVPLLMVPVNIFGDYVYQGKILGLQAVLNVILSYMLLNLMGPIGLFVATLVVQVLTCGILMPFKVASILKDQPRTYFKIFVFYFALLSASCFVFFNIFSKLYIVSIWMWFLASGLLIGICFATEFFISTLVYPDITTMAGRIIDDILRRNHD